VWKLQSGISQWKQWNSDIESMQIHGEVGVGTEFVWKSGGVTITSKIAEFVPEKRIAWHGKTFGITAYHIWEFTQTPSGVLVRTEETFTGVLSWLLPGTMRTQIAKALEHGVEVLKSEAEKEKS
jgi:hypothetical protein